MLLPQFEDARRAAPARCLILVIVSGLLSGCFLCGCATLTGRKDVAAPAITEGASAQPLIAAIGNVRGRGKFFLSSGKNDEAAIRAAQAENDAAVARAEALLQQLDGTQKKLNEAMTAKVTSLNEQLNQNANERGNITLFGVAMGVTSIALTTANPAANAAWIAGLGGASTGIISYQTVRAEDGFTPSHSRAQLNQIATAWNTAVAKYNAAFGAAGSAIITEPDWDLFKRSLIVAFTAQAECQAALLAGDGLAPVVGNNVQTLQQLLQPTIERGNQAELAVLAEQLAAANEEVEKFTQQHDEQKKLIDEADQALMKDANDAAAKTKKQNAESQQKQIDLQLLVVKEHQKLLSSLVGRLKST